MSVAGNMPSLSQIRVWDTSHLTQAATHWNRVANTWRDAFTQSWEQTQFSAGMSWEGDAADAAQYRSSSDRSKVNGLADDLQEAAGIARVGASDIHAARQRVLAAVRDANAARFIVTDDLSVASVDVGGPPEVRTAREAQACAIAADIRLRAVALTDVDRNVAAKISAATTGLHNVVLEEAPSASSTSRKAPLSCCGSDSFAASAGIVTGGWWMECMPLMVLHGMRLNHCIIWDSSGAVIFDETMWV